MTKPGADKDGANATLVAVDDATASASTSAVVCDSEASCFQRWTLSYLTPLITLGNTVGVVESDFPKLDDDAKATHAVPEFENMWRAETARAAAAEQKPNIFSVFYRLNRKQIFYSGLCELVYRGSMFAGPLILQDIVSFIAFRDRDVQDIFLLVALVFVVNVIGSACENRGMIHLYGMGVRMQSSIVGGIHRKIFRLSPQGRTEANMGLVLNMLGMDTQRIYYMLPFLHQLWSAPAQMLVVFALLIDLIGWIPTLPVVAVCIVTVISIHGANAKIKVYEMQKAIASDKRIKLFNETLNGMRVVKYYGWEAAMQAKIKTLRDVELDMIYKLAILRSVLFFAFLLCPMFMSVVAFYTYVYYDNGHDSMTAVQVFGTIALVNIARLPLMMFPVLMSTMQGARVALNRIGHFAGLEESDIEDGAVRQLTSVPKAAVQIRGTFKWAVAPEPPAGGAGAGGPPGGGNKSKGEKAEDKKVGAAASGAAESAKLLGKDDDAAAAKETFMLKDIDVNVAAGEHVQIIGSVGAGKTSLCRALFNEMLDVSEESAAAAAAAAAKDDQPQSANKIQHAAVRSGVHGTVAYVPQVAWIRNVSLRDNILFGKEYEETRYNAVVTACALDVDIATLKDGDATEIGEKGINLSGGQKQRISLARAVYSDADIMVFDDVLSAVDAHVATHIFEKCIDTILRAKTVILVTHQVQFLSRADRVIVMEAGAVTHSGTYDDIRAKSDVLDAFKQKEEKVNEEEAKKPAEGDVSAAADDVKVVVDDADKDDDDDKKKKAATEKKAPQKLVQAERKIEGSVPRDVYMFYAKLFGKGLFFLALFCFYCMSQGSMLMADWWLSRWTQLSYGTHSLEWYMSIYGGLVVAAAFATVVRIVFYARGTWRAADSLHATLIGRVMAGTMRYFDTTPQGRLTDAFSRDFLLLDTFLPMMYDNYTTLCFNVFGSLIFVGIITPWFFATLVPLVGLYLMLQSRFLNTSRTTHRLWMSSGAPLFSCVSEVMSGVTSVRAYNEMSRFNQQFDKRLDWACTTMLVSRSLTRWIDVRVDLLTALLAGAAGVFVVLARDTLTPSLAGLSLTFSGNITGMLGIIVLVGGFIETFMTSVQRIRDLGEIPAEPAAGKVAVEAQWPAEPSVEFKNVTFKYHADGDVILDDISFTLPSRAKVGIVGRTGAGKSTLSVALFRLNELTSGSILVDGRDIADVALQTLRTRMAMIPQDPVLFTGTVRYNLDPFSDCSDEQVWEALTSVELREVIEKLDGGLEADVLANGSNFSAGQKQLMCLARALLRKAKVLVLDEATASVDQATDVKIQKMIRTQFAYATVLTIAHRINTITDSDYVMVLDKGRVAEFDVPATLLQNDESLFTKLVAAHTSSNDDDAAVDDANADDSKPAAAASASSSSKN